MELTPIRIRGKKRKHVALLPSQIQQSNTSSAPSSQATLRIASQLQNPRKTKIRKKTATLAMPTLQGLPQELLEIVFLYSMNISLPRCSPSIGRKLSSRAVTMDFTMRSFFDTVDHKTNYRDRKRTSDPHMQSEILACRFFTYDFFLAYVQRAHDALVKLRGKVWESTGVRVLGVEEFERLWPLKFTRIPYLSFAEGFCIPEKLLHAPWT